MPDRADPPDDALLARARELAEARASIARLQTENVALRARFQVPRPADLPAHALPLAQLPAPSAYRGEDPVLRLDREIEEANLQLVNLGMDNAILLTREEPLRDARRRSVRKLAVTLTAAAGTGFLLLATHNVFILLPILILLLMLRGVLRLIDTIKPTDPGSRPPPPAIPPGMGF